MVHQQARPHVCQECGKAFTLPFDLVRHTRTHTGEKPFKCKLCEQSFSMKTNLKIHTATHTGEKNHSCHVCEKSFIQSGDLKRHLDTHKDLEKIFQCEFCDKGFQTKIYLKKHEYNHDQNKTFSCQICGKVFKSGTRVKLNRHIKTVHDVHGKIRPHQCPKCEKTFKKPYHLECHNKSIHEKKKEFKCDICEFASDRRDSLRNHSKTHIKRENRKQFNCDKCEKSFFSKSAMKTHMVRFHEIERPYTCDQCVVISFKTKCDLKSHMRVHNDVGRWNIYCPQFYKKFTKKGSLNLHVRTQHMGERQHKCNLCGKTFSQGAHLKTHINQVHEGSTDIVERDKQFKCKFCEKTFVSREGMKYHLRTNHIRTHQKPFECNFCGENFMNKSGMHIHITTMHNKEREHRYRCRKCDKTFFSLSAMYRHVKRTHEDPAKDLRRKENRVQA